MNDGFLLKSILLTVSYVDQFEYSLSLEEIYARLIATKKLSLEDKYSLKAVSRGVKKLAQLGLLLEVGTKQHKSEFVLPFSNNNVFSKKKKSLHAQKKWQEVAQAVELIAAIPWVEAIFVTGALAVNNTPEDDDIDFLIVTRPRRMWLSRLLVSWRAKQQGKRRSWHGEEKNSWCFNMWLDTNHLALGQQSRNIYVAYELLQAVCVFDRSTVRKRIKEKNRWVSYFLTNFEKKQFFELKKTKGTEGPIRFFDSLFGSFFDLLSFIFQLLYMLPHRTSEKVGLGFAFFHPRDTKKMIFNGWNTSLQLLKARIMDKKIVLVTGVFDVLHKEHLAFLKKAKQQGDLLFVGVETDARVKRIKGKNRPVNSQEQRIVHLQDLKIADVVFLLPEEFETKEAHQKLIQRIQPAFLAVSSHTAHQKQKKEIVEKYGGKLVVVHQFNPAVSSTKLIKTNGGKNVQAE